MNYYLKISPDKYVLYKQMEKLGITKYVIFEDIYRMCVPQIKETLYAED